MGIAQQVEVQYKIKPLARENSRILCRYSEKQTDLEGQSSALSSALKSFRTPFSLGTEVFFRL
jgi:hypothetical protein